MKNSPSTTRSPAITRPVPARDSEATPAISDPAAPQPGPKPQSTPQPTQAAPSQASPQSQQGQQASSAVLPLLTPQSPQTFRMPGEAVDDSPDSKQENPSETRPQDRSAARVGDTLLSQSLSNVPFSARTDNVAFAIRLQPTDASPSRSQAAATPPARPNHPAENANTEDTGKNQDQATSDPGATVPTKGNRDMSDPALSVKGADSQTQLAMNDTPVVTPTDLRSAPVTPEPAETAQGSSPVAAYDSQPIPAEAPKTGAATQIQLHLGDNQESSASIRVTDRGGSVNVSVHASDPQLRNSLRSNLSELSGQLSSQGWKADVKMPATMTPNGGSSDSGADGRNPSHQQPRFGQSDRQAQRDRRGNSADWQDEFEEQITGNNNPGGTH